MIIVCKYFTGLPEKGQKGRVMLFFKSKKKNQETGVESLKAFINGVTSYEEKVVFFNVIKCLEDHKHDLVRRTGITEKEYMLDLCQYCNWLLIDVLDLSNPFKNVNMEYVKNKGIIPVALIEEEIRYAKGDISGSFCYEEIRMWKSYKIFTTRIYRQQDPMGEYQKPLDVYYGREEMFDKYGKNLFIILEALMIVNSHFAKEV